MKGFKNPFDGKRYCVSKCAKDKYQRFILTPLIFLIFLLVFTTIVSFTLMIAGIILGEFVYVIHYNPLINCTIYIAFISVIGIIMLAINELIDDWVNKDYAYERLKNELKKENKKDQWKDVIFKTLSVFLGILCVLALVLMIGIIGNEFIGNVNNNPIIAGIIYSIAILVIFALLFILIFILVMIYYLLMHINKKIDIWVSTKYDQNRKECVLLEECE